MNTLVSVIVPNYNHEKFLQHRLDSIFNQTVQDFEVILLDDCSTDKSIAILNEYSRHPKVSQYIVNKENSGSPFRQWAKGIELAKGEYIWIAESDDLCELNFLEKVLLPLMENTNVGLAYCQSWSINKSGGKTGSWKEHTNDFKTVQFDSDFKSNGPDFVNDFLIYKNVIPNASATVFRKSVYKQSGGINYKIRYCGDWFLWLKILCLSDVSFISESLNYFRRHENSVISKAIIKSRSHKFFLPKNDLVMRKLFSSWLKTQSSRLDPIRNKNLLLIKKINIEESLFYILDGKLFMAFLHSIRYFFLSHESNLLFFPFKRILVSGSRFTLRVMKHK